MNTDILDAIYAGEIFRVVFKRQRDQEFRSATGYILPQHRPIEMRKPDIIVYYDLGIMAIRSFRIDSVASIRMMKHEHLFE